MIGVVALAAVADRVWGRRSGNDLDRYQNGVCTVVRVAEPGVIDVDTPDGPQPATRVRLWGVNMASARGTSSAEAAAQPGGFSIAGRELLRHRVRLELAPTRTRDPEGHLLAYVYLVPEGECVNELLLDGGWARADARWPHPFVERYHTLEARAKRRGIGLWSDSRSPQTTGGSKHALPASGR